MLTMKSMTIGLFNDSEMGGILGKKGTVTDIKFYNRKDGDVVYTFIEPVDEKVSPKSQIMGTIDAAIVSFENPTPEMGETILMLDALGITKGVAVAAHGTDLKQVVEMTKGTTLESFTMIEKEQHHILDTLSKIDKEFDTGSPVSVDIDHSFSVRGVGEIALGFVKTGIVKKHQKLTVMPSGKEILVRSIQMHDKDYDEAPAGSRVGLCIKGASVEEMKRGTIICEPGACISSSKINLKFSRNKFYADGPSEGSFHATVGMQTIPVKVSGISGDSLTIEADRIFVYRESDVFILLDLNAAKVHLIGSGKAL